MHASQSVPNLNIDLWPVESTVARVQLPRLAKLVQRPLQLSFGFIPLRDFSHVFIRSGRQHQFKGKTKHIVYIFQELQTASNFRLHLVRSTENMSVVLLEAPDSSQATQRSRQLVPPC